METNEFLENEVSSWMRTAGSIEEYPDRTPYDLIIESMELLCYIGTTKRQKIKEGFEFMGPRGSPLGYGILCLPVLCKEDGTHYKKKEAIELLGAICQEIYYSKLRYNVNSFEGLLQHEIGALPLGHRLHRAESTGTWNDPNEGHDCYLARTYITYFKKTSTKFGHEDIWEENTPEGVVRFIEINEVKVRIMGRIHGRK